MTLYRKKPVTVEAMQWDGTAEGATPIVDWVLAGNGTARYRDHFDNPTRDGGSFRTGPALLVDTLEGTMNAGRGDWIIRGVKGEFYPCKPDIFAATYDEVTID